MVGHVRQQENKAFAERLKSALIEAGISTSPTVVAHEFNLRYWGKSITVHAARNWLLGLSLPNQDKLVALAKWLQVSPQELRFGPSSTPQVQTVSHLEKQLTLKDREMLSRYATLQPKDKNTVCEVVGALYRAPSPPPLPEKPPEHP